MSELSLTILVPVYNECGSVERGLQTISDFACAHGLDHEILIIESGSTDGTFEKCDELAQRLPHVRVIHEGARNGFGSAVKLGYREARKDVIRLNTVDLSFPLESVLEALPLMKKQDYVVSYRSEDRRAFTRRLQSFVYNRLITTVLGLKVRHVNSGFRLLPREVVGKLNLISNGWFLDAEVLYRLKEAGLAFAEIPVPLIDRSEGKSSVGALGFVGVLKEPWVFLRRKDETKVSQQG